MNKFAAAIVKDLCPVCTKEVDSAVVINTKLTKKAAQHVEDLHGKGQWSQELCPDCQEMKKKGFILIGAVQKKTDDPKNPYRSGNIWCIKHEAAEQLFAPEKAPESGIAFLDVEIAQSMGFPNVNLDA